MTVYNYGNPLHNAMINCSLTTLDRSRLQATSLPLSNLSQIFVFPFVMGLGATVVKSTVTIFNWARERRLCCVNQAVAL